MANWHLTLERNEIFFVVVDFDELKKNRNKVLKIMRNHAVTVHMDMSNMFKEIALEQ